METFFAFAEILKEESRKQQPKQQAGQISPAKPPGQKQPKAKRPPDPQNHLRLASVCPEDEE